MGPRGNYKIAKINHKTRPAYRHYHKASRTTGRSAHIFGVYDQSRGHAENVERYIRVSLPSRASTARAGGFSPRKENCTAILHRHSKCRCKTSALLPSPPSLSSLLHLSPRSHLPICISSHHSSCFPGNPFALREYESVRRNDEGIRIKSYFPRCFAIKRLKYHKTADAERLSQDSGILHPALSDLPEIVRQ